MLRVRSVITGVAGAPYYSNFYFLGTDAVQAGNSHQAVTFFWSGLIGSLRGGMTITTESSVADIDPGTGDIVGAFSVEEDTQTTSGVGEPLPVQIQALINWDTASYVGGRRIQGRTFVPGMPEGWNNDGFGPYGAARSLVTTQAQALVDDENSTLVVWSRKNGTAVPVLSGTCNTRWATLRSRKN